MLDDGGCSLLLFYGALSGFLFFVLFCLWSLIRWMLGITSLSRRVESLAREVDRLNGRLEGLAGEALETPPPAPPVLEGAPEAP